MSWHSRRLVVISRENIFCGPLDANSAPATSSIGGTRLPAAGYEPIFPMIGFGFHMPLSISSRLLETRRFWTKLSRFWMETIWQRDKANRISNRISPPRAHHCLHTALVRWIAALVWEG